MNQSAEVERYALSVQLNPLGDLVDSTFDFALEDQSNEDLLHFRLADVELLGKERHVESRVGFNKGDEVLRSQCTEKITDVRGNKGVIRECRTVF